MSPSTARMYLPLGARVQMEKSHPNDDPSSYFLQLALHATGFDKYDVTRHFHRFRNHGNSFLEQLISGKVKPVPNKYQEVLQAMFPETNIIHFYIGTVRGDVPTHYMVWMKNEDGLFVPRHRKIRKVPENLARDGVIFSFGRITPQPLYALEREPSMTRVYTGGRVTRDFLQEIESEKVGYETRQQISHAAQTVSLHGSLHRDKMTIYFNPGAIRLKVDYTSGDGYTTPFEFTPGTVQDYTPTPTQKPRVVIHGSATNESGFLFTKPNIRHILPQVKNAPEYKPPLRTSASIYLTCALRYGLLPFIGIEEPDGGISIVGTVYNPEEDRVHYAQYAAGRTERSCAGLPVLRIENRQAQKLRWLPNHVLAELLASAIWDGSPDAEAVRLRWIGVAGLFSGFRVNRPEQYVQFYAELGMPLPAGSEDHIAARMQVQEDYNDMIVRKQKHG